MILLPAIDLVGGRCVRLAQGDFARETAYSDDPAAALRGFAAQGAEEAHVVDLDGAKARAPRQHDLLIALAAQSGLQLQVAGGFRTLDQVRHMLDAGVTRVVIGSLAVDQPDVFARMIDAVGADRLTIALDVRLHHGVAMVATHGWATDCGETLEVVLARFPAVRHLLVTDIARDGMLAGPNLALTAMLVERYPAIEVQGSGGVAGLPDLAALRAAGAARAIVGKALWERRFTVAEGIEYARG